MPTAKKTESTKVPAKVQAALNVQIEAEFYSSNLYLAMAAYFEALQLKGFAHWMKNQAEEERQHALKLFQFLADRGGAVTVPAIAQPPKDYKSVRGVFAQTLAHEQKVTARIHQLYALAQQEKDYATAVMLQWFVTEQVEEESQVEEILSHLERIPETGGSLLYLDKELGKRGK